MTGLERNSDIVFAAAYAPLLQVRLCHCLVELVRLLIPNFSCSTSTQPNGCVLVVSLTERLNLKPNLQPPDLIAFE